MCLYVDASFKKKCNNIQWYREWPAVKIRWGNPVGKGGISWLLLIAITTQREKANKETQHLPLLFPTDITKEKELHHLNIKTSRMPLKYGSCHWRWPKFSYFHVCMILMHLCLAFLATQSTDVILPLSGILKSNRSL